MTDGAGARMRRLMQAASRARELRWRTPPPLRVGAGRSGRPVVYYLTPDLDTPSGGVRNMYRHVDLLNAAGIEAAVLHAGRGFRCNWFANETRTVDAARVILNADDLLVVSECYGPALDRLPRGVRKIIFNQGAHHTFHMVAYAQTAPGAPYTGLDGLIGLLTVSDDSAALLRYTFPALPVHQARLVIDDTLFRPGHPGEPAGRRIGYLPRRRRQEQEYLLHTLRSRGVLDGWEPVPIQGLTEAQTAEAMRGCAIFLSFSEREGFGLPPAEAMASGCYVVGFTGLGGREFFDPAYCTPVPESDILAYAQAVEDAVRRYDADPDDLAKAGRMASERVLGRYHAAGLTKDLLSVYRALLVD